ncbi:unnamed protein product [Blepharisma stoltei]|uniref:phenylalanine--tRNA ligase n=1 Tax=Blepharisma stoltei TaxID=1481888 RepID=A0AAU9J798_9CILI|nr:unnamed protein product [Blepharisma stoltei]
MSISNITPKIIELTKRKLLSNPNHPLSILRSKMYSFVHKTYPGVFITKDDYDPVVGVRENFDNLLIAPDHPSRRPSDTYYIDENTVLRTHTTAHDCEMLKNHNAFLMTGDVYRRDEIDSTHYPAFHQLEGGRVWNKSEFSFAAQEKAHDFALTELKGMLEGLARECFGDVEMRWYDNYFPFVDPGLELEIRWKDNWMEVLGCGVYHPQVLRNAGKSDDFFGLAFGIGLERWAMKVFDIPDIRLFWSEDQRFLSQFSATKGITKFKSFSKFPLCYKDISFWVPEKFEENDFFELVREVGGDLVERVEKTDKFSKGDKTSYCFRVNYRSMERNLTNEEIDELQFRLREKAVADLKITLR